MNNGLLRHLGEPDIGNILTSCVWICVATYSILTGEYVVLWLNLVI